VLSNRKANVLRQRGPTALDLRAIIQKRDLDNLRATFNKIMYKTTDSLELNLKREDKRVRRWNYYTIANYLTHERGSKHRVHFSAKSCSLGNLSLLTNFQKLSTVLSNPLILYVFMKRCYACSNWNCRCDTHNNQHWESSADLEKAVRGPHVARGPTVEPRCSTWYGLLIVFEIDVCWKRS